jgi:hypothetical protein
VPLPLLVQKDQQIQSGKADSQQNQPAADRQQISRSYRRQQTWRHEVCHHEDNSPDQLHRHSDQCEDDSVQQQRQTTPSGPGCRRLALTHDQLRDFLRNR